MISEAPSIVSGMSRDYYNTETTVVKS
jgi:hypothetical protein